MKTLTYFNILFFTILMTSNTFATESIPPESTVHSVEMSERPTAVSYGGCASVVVVDCYGNRRTLRASTTCCHRSSYAAQSALQSSLSYKLSWDEKFITCVNYDIDSCYW